MDSIYIQYILVLKYLTADINFPIEIIMLVIEIIYMCRLIIKCGNESTYYTINNKNYVCDMTQTNNIHPQKFIIDERIKSVSRGESNLFIMTNPPHTESTPHPPNKIYHRGNNVFGQLGLGHQNPQSSLILFMFKKKIESIYSKGDSTFAITNKKKCYGWGYGKRGKLGLGDSCFASSPRKICIKNVVSVYCGEFHTIFLTDIECFVCGSNDYGQLGLGDCDAIASSQSGDAVTSSQSGDAVISSRSGDNVRLQKLPLENIITADCGVAFSVAVTRSHHPERGTTEGLYAWGANDLGQLGLGHTEHKNLPQKVDVENSISVSCGNNHTMVLTKNGTLYGWGVNLEGQLGIGDQLNKFITTPQKINLTEFIIGLDCGANHTIVQTAKNEVYGWGANSNGQLGLGDTENRYIPTKLNFNLSCEK